jgi:uncharacterized protein (TIGR00730 family)
MPNRKNPGHLFHTAAEDRRHARREGSEIAVGQINSPAYKLAYDDIDFLLRDEMRPVRFFLELSKPELLLQERGINHAVVIFGSARTSDMEKAIQRRDMLNKALQNEPKDKALLQQLARAEVDIRHATYYEQARRLGHLISERSGCEECPCLHVVTGGGPGIMEAANRGAQEAGAETVGLNIVLPHEQTPNPYITPELCFQFHYFAMRKMHFMLRARALVIFPGGYGTFDELFEALTLIQTGKIKPLPVLLFGRDYWQKVIDFDFMVKEGMISPNDVDIFHYVDDEEEAWQIIRDSLEID